MKKLESQKLRLGLFVLLGTFLFVFGVYLIGQKKLMFKKTASIYSIFTNVNGLQIGNNVRYSGINAGVVEEIEMINDTAIKIKMIIEEKFVEHIKQNAIATISTDGLVGNMIVNIIPRNGKAKRIKDGDKISSYSKIGTDEILNTLNTTNENAAILTSDLLKISSLLIEGKGTLGIILNDTTMANDLKNSISNLRAISAKTGEVVTQINKVISEVQTNDKSVFNILLNDTASGGHLKQTIVGLENSSIEIEQTISSMNEILEKMNSGNGTIPYLLNDTSVVNELKNSIQNINQGTDNFNQSMEALKHNFLLRRYFKKQEKKEKQ